MNICKIYILHLLLSGYINNYKLKVENNKIIIQISKNKFMDCYYKSRYGINIKYTRNEAEDHFIFSWFNIINFNNNSIKIEISFTKKLINILMRSFTNYNQIKMFLTIFFSNIYNLHFTKEERIQLSVNGFDTIISNIDNTLFITKEVIKLYPNIIAFILNNENFYL